MMRVKITSAKSWSKMARGFTLRRSRCICFSFFSYIWQGDTMTQRQEILLIVRVNPDCAFRMSTLSDFSLRKSSNEISRRVINNYDKKQRWINFSKSLRKNSITSMNLYFRYEFSLIVSWRKFLRQELSAMMSMMTVTMIVSMILIHNLDKGPNFARESFKKRIPLRIKFRKIQFIRFLSELYFIPMQE